MNKRKPLTQNKGGNSPCPVCGSNNARGIWNDKNGAFTMECLDCGLKTIVSSEVIGMIERIRNLEEDTQHLDRDTELWMAAVTLALLIVGWRSSDKYLIPLIALTLGVAWGINSLQRWRRRAKHKKNN